MIAPLEVLAALAQYAPASDPQQLAEALNHLALGELQETIQPLVSLLQMPPSEIIELLLARGAEGAAPGAEGLNSCQGMWCWFKE